MFCPDMELVTVIGSHLYQCTADIQPTAAPSHSGVKAPLQKPWQQRLSDPCLMQFSTYNIGPISTFFRCEASLLVGVSVVRPSVTNSYRSNILYI